MNGELRVITNQARILRANSELKVGDQVQMTEPGMFLWGHKPKNRPTGRITKTKHEEHLIWVKLDDEENIARPWHSGFWQRSPAALPESENLKGEGRTNA